jgi:dihydrofolate reductase
MNINLIWAEAHHHVIGKNGVMPWHLPEDLAHFKRITLGAPVIMGRKTWDSIPERFRPLPGRANIVISRQTDFLAGHVDKGVQTAESLQAALDMASRHLNAANSADVWVIGGAQIYAQALPLASRVVITEIDAAYEGDAFAPALDAAWTQTARTSHTAANGLRYAFTTYLRS